MARLLQLTIVDCWKCPYSHLQRKQSKKLHFFYNLQCTYECKEEKDFRIVARRVKGWLDSPKPVVPPERCRLPEV